MPDYSKGKIYKLWSPSTGLTYIGSTCQSIAMRLAGHVRSKKCHDSGKSLNYLTSYEILDYNDYRIDLLEEYPCENRMQLNKREGEIILETDCVNKIVAGRTKKQYYEANKETLNKQSKQYRERTGRSKKILCSLCGRILRTDKMKRHQTTKICLINR